MTTKKDSMSKTLLLGIQHVFAMFGSTVLVPALTGLSPSIALFCAGVGTLIFHAVTGFKVPTFLGSSFAFIAAINIVAPRLPDATGALTLSNAEMLPYATGGIIVAGVVYLLLALVVRLIGTERILKLFPPVVTGPMVIIIGMMLAPTAINSITAPIGGNSVLVNWAVAGLTIAIIVGVTLFAKGFFKLVPILFGIVGGYVIACLFGIVDFTAVNAAPWFSFPEFFLPKFSLQSILLIAPLAIVTFIEHIGDLTASSAVVGKDFIKDPGLHRTLLGDGLATMFAGLVGGPANTTYSENTGVLAATKNYNPRTLQLAAVFAILLAFVSKLGAILQTLPGPVMGGVSVVLFGMIASVGLRTLVEKQVDFKKSRNLLIVAVMLVLGLGGAEIRFSETVAISGTALAAILGIVMNLVLPDKIEKDEQ